MKKILTSFLLIAMIAGCVQQGPTEAEKPEEPPVVEQPEKPVEQEKSEETKYDLDELVTIETIDISVTDFQREINDRWDFSYQLDKVQINLDSDEINQFNQQMAERYDKYVNGLQYEGDTLRKGYFMDISAYLNKNILSLMIRDQWFLFEAGLRPANYEIIHIDLETGHILSNNELLAYLNLDKDNLYYVDNDEEVSVNDNTDLVLKDDQLYALENINLTKLKAITYREMLFVKER